MKKLILYTFATLLAFCAKAEAIDASKAEKFVQNVTKEGIEEIINSNVSTAEKDARFEKLFNTYLDLDYIGRFVLGRYWKTATPAQRKEFIDVYRAFNVKTWSQRFDEFKGKSFDFAGTTPSNSQGQVFVNTTVDMENAEPVKVVWRVKEDNGQMKIIDIIIENVSLAITARNEYTAFIKKSPNGIDGLIADLKRKSEK